jgi:hypothetical protein
VIIRGVGCGCNVTEEMTALQGMKGATGMDLMEESEKILVRSRLGY